MSRIWAVVLALCLLTGRNLAQQTARIEGKVIDATSGKGIAGAVVEVAFEGEGRYSRAPLETDQQGAFVVDNLAAGAYLLVVTANDYSPWVERVVVFAGKSKSVTVKLLRRTPELSVARTFEVKYKDPAELASVIKPFLGAGGEVLPGASARVLVVRDTPDVLDKVAAFLARYDVAPKQIRLDLHLFLANGTARQEGEIASELAQVVAKLKALFRYKRFSLLASGTATISSGKRCLMGLEGPERSLARITIDRVEYVEADGGVIRLEGFGLSGPPPGVTLSTTLNVPLGEFVVVGRGSVKGPEEAVVVVVKAELLK